MARLHCLRDSPCGDFAPLHRRRRHRRIKRAPHGRPSTWRAELASLVLPQSLDVDGLAVLRGQELVGKAQYLKTVAVTDDPEIQLVPFAVGGRDLHKAGQASLLFDGSIGGRRPDTGSGKEGRSRSRAFPVRNLRGVKRIADVVNARTGAPRAASG